MENTFKRAYNLIPVGAENQVKAEIMKQTGWSPATFNRRLNGEIWLKNPELLTLKPIFEK